MTLNVALNLHRPQFLYFQWIIRIAIPTIDQVHDQFILSWQYIAVVECQLSNHIAWVQNFLFSWMIGL